MKNLCRMIVFIYGIILTNPGLAYAFDANTALPDSLITEDGVYKYTFSDFNKAVKIMEELRRRETLSQFRLDVTEGDLYFNTGRYLQALKYYKRTLESDSVRNNDAQYMDQVHRMISCYDCLHDVPRKTNYVQLLLNKAEECGNIEMKSVALFNMGKMIYYQSEKQQGYDMIKKAIVLMKQSDYKYKYDNLRYNYNTLLIMLQRDKRNEEALQVLDELEEVVEQATNLEPSMKGLSDKERKTLYAQRAVIFSKLGRLKEADEAFRMWESIGGAYSKDDYLITPYLMDREQYDKVIAEYTPREAFLYSNKDTINYHMMAVKRTLAKAYGGKKNYKRAAKYFEELAVLTDSLKVREQRSSAIELAAIYETQEQQAQLHEEIKQVKIRNALLILASVILFFLLLLYIRNLQHTRIIRHKNSIMIDTIEELLEYKEELYETRRKLYTLQESKSLAQPEDTGEKITAEDKAIDNLKAECVQDTTEDDEREFALFEELDYIVTHDRLYLNPDLSRDDLMRLICVNKNRIGKILQHHSNMNATGYINNKRLEYAVKLLKDAPNYTITAIAEQCGLPNVPTFNRLFRNKYGMTPTEYRNGLKKTDNKAGIDTTGQSD